MHTLHRRHLVICGIVAAMCVISVSRLQQASMLGLPNPCDYLTFLPCYSAPRTESVGTQSSPAWSPHQDTSSAPGSASEQNADVAQQSSSGERNPMYHCEAQCQIAPNSFVPLPPGTPTGAYSDGSCWYSCDSLRCGSPCASIREAPGIPIGTAGTISCTVRTYVSDPYSTPPGGSYGLPQSRYDCHDRPSTSQDPGAGLVLPAPSPIPESASSASAPANSCLICQYQDFPECARATSPDACDKVIPSAGNLGDCNWATTDELRPDGQVVSSGRCQSRFIASCQDVIDANVNRYN
jgi:hypothetical protein